MQIKELFSASLWIHAVQIFAQHICYIIIISCLEKTELFLELYGNVIMNSHALEYLKNKSNDLIRYTFLFTVNFQLS